MNESKGTSKEPKSLKDDHNQSISFEEEDDHTKNNQSYRNSDQKKFKNKIYSFNIKKRSHKLDLVSYLDKVEKNNEYLERDAKVVDAFFQKMEGLKKKEEEESMKRVAHNKPPKIIEKKIQDTKEASKNFFFPKMSMKLILI